jgi:protein SCO1/2
VGLLALAGLLAACGSGDPRAPAADVGTTLTRPIPPGVSALRFTDQHGVTSDLAELRGKTLLVVPFLTLCTDICPLDTGNLLQVEHALISAGMAHKVQLVELSVDPARDSPARLAAYAHLTGATWELATETPQNAAAFEQFFGWYVQRVPENNPPSLDWWTGQPLTYDVNHSDGFVVIDAHGTERFATGSSPDFHGTLDPTLQQFLTDEGRQHLAHPLQPSWTPDAALQVIGWLLDRSVPTTGTAP